MTDDQPQSPTYSKTLNVPRPDVKNPDGLDTNPDSIPQRAGLPKREPQTLDFWRIQRVYEESLKPTTGLGTFILHDGPPFSNGNIHIGHAFNKILKDVTVKYRAMQGYKAPYVPGWDNNGLPIEVLVAKEFRAEELRPRRMQIRAPLPRSRRQWSACPEGTVSASGHPGRLGPPVSDDVAGDGRQRTGSLCRTGGERLYLSRPEARLLVPGRPDSPGRA